MYKNLITPLALFAIIITTAACGNKTAPAPVVQSTSVLPKSIITGQVVDAYATFSYNSDSLLTAITFRPAAFKTNETYTYTGNKLATITSPTLKTVITYNAAGQVTQTESRTIADNRLWALRKYSYNTAGKVSTINRYDIDGDEQATLALTYTYHYNADGLITSITDTGYRPSSNSGEWTITGYSAALTFQPLILEKLIFGDGLDFVVLATQPRLPLSIHYRQTNTVPPYFFTDTYQYILKGVNISSIPHSSALTHNGSESTYSPVPFDFKY